jgi:hypothetical protein
MSKQIDGVTTQLAGPVPFKVEQLRQGALPGASPEEAAAFWQQLTQLQRSTSAASLVLQNALKKVAAMRTALARTPSAPGSLDGRLHELRETLLEFEEQLRGNRARRSVGEKNNPTIGGRLWFALGGAQNTTYGPTPNSKKSFDIAGSQFAKLKAALEDIVDRQLPEMERALSRAGAPWIEGQPIPEN